MAVEMGVQALVMEGECIRKTLFLGGSGSGVCLGLMLERIGEGR
jgi:hypothetical protein